MEFYYFCNKINRCATDRFLFLLIGKDCAIKCHVGTKQKKRYTSTHT